MLLLVENLEENFSTSPYLSLSDTYSERHGEEKTKMFSNGELMALMKVRGEGSVLCS